MPPRETEFYKFISALNTISKLVNNFNFNKKKLICRTTKKTKDEMLRKNLRVKKEKQKTLFKHICLMSIIA